MVPEPFRDARILIVDDERSMVRLLEELLAHAGYQHLRSTTDSREVLSHCAEFEPDLILAAFLRRKLAGGVLVVNEKLRSA